ncbi:hypothetical protein VN97_g13061, partial [Penicillium thymicola]
MTGPVNHHPIL